MVLIGKNQADRVWMPVRQEGHFLTVEVGYTQLASKLERDITSQLYESRGRLRMDITIDIKQGSGNIEIKSSVPARPYPQHIYITAHQRQVIDRRRNQQLPPHCAEDIDQKREKRPRNNYHGGGIL